MVAIILPKVIERVNPDKPLIFMAGPIRGGGDWQSKMVEELISQCGDVQIACPSRWTNEHLLSKFFIRPFSNASNRQLHWERHYMELSALDNKQFGTLLFWLGLEDQNSPHPGPEPYAMDTRREIGKFTAFKKMRRLNRELDCRMVVGGSEDFYGLSVIRDELDDAEDKEFPFYTSMKELAAAALKIAI